MQLTKEQAAAFAAKRTYYEGLNMDLDQLHAGVESRNFSTLSYATYPMGDFIALENIRLQWLAADYFAFIPKHAHAFSFRRSNGEVITPRHMFTDGGSIPRLFQSSRDLSPWTYGAAYLLHDWLFDLHHCGQTSYSFETVRDILMEAVKTLMEIYPDRVPKSWLAFQLIFAGVDSNIARRIWERRGPCPIPPDTEE